MLVALILLIATLAYAGYWWYYARFWVWTDNAYITGNLIRVEAQATGIITQVLVEETQRVKKGDLLIRLDEHQARARLGRTRGGLGAEVRRIAALFVKQRQIRQKLTAKRARLDLVRHDVVRFRQALPSGAVSEQVLENALDQVRALHAEVREAREELQSITARVGGVSIRHHPAVEAAKHRFIEAYLEYIRQRIWAPASGYVAKRKAQVGDHVHPGVPLMTIVPLDHLWVEVNLRETDLRQVRPGQPALVNVDVYGKRHTYHGTVEGLVPGTGSVFALLPPENATGNFIHIVERVPIRVALSKKEILEHPVRPGLSTKTYIHVSEPGRPVGDSLAATSTQEYETDIYANELTNAETLAQKIILENLVLDND
ncbi:HlyD family secretion protein [Nitrococcus mobilis]|uniref:Secretion protein HlyD family n=1 Tax=Nitrococcus mobilis Nb-231 TaxID=314278 RepID=A4BVG6_9GAMM|nr:HlyD family secretion protein [Nitrococcus mobilis]EAR20286.1 Secretion protein HlyD family [Nitrococcus mobilis Nb-231]